MKNVTFKKHQHVEISAKLIAEAEAGEGCAVSHGSTIMWEDDGPDRIRGYVENPKTTLFIIDRHPEKSHRGHMTGAVIPDEDEKPDGILGNALISWLQGFAAPMYLREYEERLFARMESKLLACVVEYVNASRVNIPAARVQNAWNELCRFADSSNNPHEPCPPKTKE